MSEYYNKWAKSLEVDCNCKNSKPFKPPVKKNNCCYTGMKSHKNTLEILVKQLQREVEKLVDETQKKLLCQDKKIAETCIYIKNNLSNYIRELIDSMVENGEMEEIIETIGIQDIEDIKTSITNIKHTLNDLEDRVSRLENN